MAWKRLVVLIPFALRFLRFHPIFKNLFCQLELVFWIWLNIMPHLTPAFLQQHQPFKTPVDLIAVRALTPVATTLYKALSSVVPEQFWQTFVVYNLSSFLSIAVWSKFVTQETADAILHYASTSRRLLLPALTLFAWPLQGFGILYVSFGLPMAQSVAAGASSIQWLQYWVFHCLVHSVLWIRHFWRVRDFGIGQRRDD